MMTPPRMSIVSRTVDIPPPRRGRRELAEDTGVRLGLHIKSAEQAMMAAKTEALRSFGLTVAQYAAMLSQAGAEATRRPPPLLRPRQGPHRLTHARG